MPFNPESFRVRPRATVRLDSIRTDETAGIDKEDAITEFERLQERIVEWQELMFAEGKHALLIVLQAMDGAGKDSTIRSVFGPVNPQGCHVISFKAPTSAELQHDFLWRIHPYAPPKGHLHIFNRSHYEDVLIVRVKQLVEKSIWKKRFDHINAFEEMLADGGVTVLKFYLHVSKEYQKKQFEERLAEPHKQWKFNPHDLESREQWGDYMKAYEDAMSKCSTKAAPWYIVPAEKKWFRNLLIARVIADTMDSFDMQYPPIDFDPRTIKIE